MEHKVLFGSRMLKLNNCRDEDWYIFSDRMGKELRSSEYKSISTYTRMLKSFTEGKNNSVNVFKALTIYQHSAPFFDESYPLKHFNIMEHKRVWIEQLKGFVNLESTEKWSQTAETLPKQFYHLLYQYYMITENAHWISDEAKAEVQKIHDLEMPSSYFYELRNLINSL